MYPTKDELLKRKQTLMVETKAVDLLLHLYEIQEREALIELEQLEGGEEGYTFETIGKGRA